MMYRPFGWPPLALLATALALIWFHPLSLGSFASPPAFVGQAFQPVRHPLLRAGVSPAPVVGALLAAPGRLHSETLPLSLSATLSQAPAQTGAMTEIRALFAEFLKLHAAKKMDEWRDKMFLSEAVCFRTAPDGQVAVFPVAELARTIAEEAKTLDEQHETFEDVRIEVHGNAAHYATSWTLFHNGKIARKGRAFFSLVKKEGAWRIASLVWYRE